MITVELNSPFSYITRAVKFTSKLFGRALSRRIKATILYATETGKSEQYAKQLSELLNHAFNAQVGSIAFNGIIIGCRSYKGCIDGSGRDFTEPHPIITIGTIIFNC